MEVKASNGVDAAKLTADASTFASRERSLWQLTWRRFLQHRLAVVASVTLIVVCVACMLAFASPYDPYEIELYQKFQAPSLAHPMGTDELGRDLLTRILYGGRMSLLIGICAMIVGLLIGIMVGALAGYYGRVLDNILMRITDAFFSFPSLFVLILVGAMLRDTPFGEMGSGVPAIVIVIGALSWMSVARLVRASYLSIREKEYVQVAHAFGAGNLRIMARHILPNAIGPILVAGTLQVGYAILTESGLSFLGFGVKPPTPTWGNMLTYAQRYMTRYPWVAVFPGLMIFISVISINYVGDGLRDALDPYKVLGTDFKG